MIHRATAKDLPLILGILATVPDLIHEHYSLPSDLSLIESALPPWLLHKNEHVWVDTELEAVCRVVTMPERREVAVVWLLPHRLWEDTSGVAKPLLAATLKEALGAYADVADWIVYAEFAGAPDKGLVASNIWKGAIPEANVALMVDRDRYRVAAKMGDAVRRLEPSVGGLS